MTRRGAIIGAMLLAGGKLAADQQTLTTTNVFKLPPPGLLTFVFGGDSFTSLKVQFGDGSVVTLTEADIKRELTHQHTPRRWGADSMFMVDGRRLEVCEDCGQTYWGQTDPR